MTETVKIACIVEGHGEEEALPVLLRRILAEYRPFYVLAMPRPLRLGKGKLLKENELERSVELMARRVAPLGAILILVDADDDCAAHMGPALLARARTARADIPTGVVFAVREFEAWFLAGARSLQGLRGLPPVLVPPTAPESIRGAKEWLTRQRVDGRSYHETLDQAPLAARVSLEDARQASSFDKLVRDVLRLSDIIAERSYPDTTS
ncbi:DUF4276 family protein [Pyxidicoccus sp. 3LFB2]